MAAAVIGLVSDAIRKTVSRVIGSPPIVRAPATATSVSPCRDTSATAPGSAAEPHASSTSAEKERRSLLHPDRGPNHGSGVS